MFAPPALNTRPTSNYQPSGCKQFRSSTMNPDSHHYPYGFNDIIPNEQCILQIPDVYSFPNTYPPPSEFSYMPTFSPTSDISLPPEFSSPEMWHPMPLQAYPPNMIQTAFSDTSSAASAIDLDDNILDSLFQDNLSDAAVSPIDPFTTLDPHGGGEYTTTPPTMDPIDLDWTDIPPYQALEPTPIPTTFPTDSWNIPSPMIIQQSLPPPTTCSNCGTTNTSLWRRDKSSGRKLCNACKLFADLHGVMRPESLWKAGYVKRRKRKGKMGRRAQRGREWDA